MTAIMLSMGIVRLSMGIVRLSMGIVRGGRRSVFAVSVTTRVAKAGFVVQGGRMDVAFVLVHSPSVGPLTWAPIAQRMEASGIRVIVPSLVGVADASPPFCQPVVS